MIANRLAIEDDREKAAPLDESLATLILALDIGFSSQLLIDSDIDPAETISKAVDVLVSGLRREMGKAPKKRRRRNGS